MSGARSCEANRSCDANREQGAYLVVYALLAVAFFTMAAVVLDIAALRQGRRADRTAADLAVAAGVTELEVTDPSSFSGACEAVWGYVLANRTEAEGTMTPPDCDGTFPVGVACTPAMAERTAGASVGPISVEITHPVPDTSPLMRAETPGGDIVQAVDPTTDGRSCERLAVRVLRQRTFLFSQIAGVNGGTTDVHSVARALTAPSTDVPAVLALDPTSCGALRAVSGVLEMGGATRAGRAVVDSNGTGAGCAAGHTIEAGGGTLRAITAGSEVGQISSFAAGTASPTAYAESDVSSGRLSPRPVGTFTRTGRGFVDTRYHCPACVPVRDPIRQLEADRDASGALVPTPDATYSGPCTIDPGPPSQINATHLYVDCDELVLNANLTFAGASVTVRGNVTIGSTGCLAINDATCGGSGFTPQPADLFVRGRIVKDVKGAFAAAETFVYTGGNLELGVDPDTTVGNSAVVWSAPTTGPFEDLLFWSESTGAMIVGEQRTISLTGTFFAPNAPVLVNPRDGGAGVTAAMQVIGRTVTQSGNGTFRLQPAPDRANATSSRQVRLIR